MYIPDLFIGIIVSCFHDNPKRMIQKIGMVMANDWAVTDTDMVRTISTVKTQMIFMLQSQ